jgi:hypothetical protein
VPRSGERARRREGYSDPLGRAGTAVREEEGHREKKDNRNKILIRHGKYT